MDTWGAESTLKAIPIILRQNDFFNINFERWMAKKKVTMEMLKDDPEERRYRQCCAYSRALEHLHRSKERTCRGRSRSRSRSSTRSKTRGCKRRHSRSPPNSSKGNTPRDANRKSKLNSSNETNRGYGRHGKRSRLDSDSDKIPLRASAEPQQARSSAEAAESIPVWGQKLIEAASQRDIQVNRRFEELEREIRILRFGLANKSSTSTASELSKEPQTATNLLRMSLARNQLTLFQTLEQSSPEIISIDKAEAREHRNQIKELTVSINQEKKRRDAALAAVIVHEWRNKPQQSSLLMSVYIKLNLQDQKVLALQAKLKNRLSWLKAEATGHDAQCKGVGEISSRLEEELRERDLLGDERQQLSKELLQHNEEIRTLISNLLKEA